MRLHNIISLLQRISDPTDCHQQYLLALAQKELNAVDDVFSWCQEACRRNAYPDSINTGAAFGKLRTLLEQ